MLRLGRVGLWRMQLQPSSWVGGSVDDGDGHNEGERHATVPAPRRLDRVRLLAHGGQHHEDERLKAWHA
jgi:hypothetical protein